MPPEAVAAKVESLKDLTRRIQTAEGFRSVVAALRNHHGATIDGAWGSSSALAAAALGLHAPQTLLVVIAHPRDVDGWSAELTSFAGVSPLLFPGWDNLASDRSLI